MMKKKLLSALLCVAMVASLVVGCGGKEEPAAEAPAATEEAEAPAATEEAEAPKTINLGLANINEKATFGKLVKMGFEEACEARGWTLTYVDNNSDGQTAVTNAQILANNEVDFAVDLNVDQSVADAILETFNDAEIPVLAVDIALGDAPFFGIDSHEMGLISGQYAAAYAAENWDSEIEYVVLMTQIASGDEVNKRCRSAVEALEDAGITIGEVMEIEAQGDTATAQSMFASFLTAHPDAEKIAVFTINENPATGAHAAAVTADREWDIRIFSAGVGAQFVDPMYEAEGDQSWVTSVACFPELYGEQVCQIVEQYLETGTLDAKYNADLVSVDWSNITEYYPQDNLPWNKIN